MIRVDTVDDLNKKYPGISREVISEIFLCGYDNYKAKISDVIIDLFMSLNANDAPAYRDRITKLYIDSNITVDHVRS